MEQWKKIQCDEKSDFTILLVWFSIIKYMLIPAFNLTSTSLYASFSYHTYCVCPITNIIFQNINWGQPYLCLKKMQYGLKTPNLQK